MMNSLGRGLGGRGRRPTMLRAAALFLGTAFLHGCGGLSASYRFKMTVEVETPAGTRTGFSVMQVTAAKELLPGAHTPAVHIDLAGEAVAVGLDDGRTMFVSLKTPSGTDSLASAATLALAPEIRTGKASGRPDRFIDAARRLGSGDGPRGAAMLPGESYPMMIWFKDPSDPKSATLLDPNKLAETLGPGVALKRITVEVTTEPVTRGIEARLPSFAPETGFAAWRVSLPNEDPRRRMARNDFITGVSQ
jgi:hypothetical protein